MHIFKQALLLITLGVCSFYALNTYAIPSTLQSMMALSSSFKDAPRNFDEGLQASLKDILLPELATNQITREESVLFSVPKYMLSPQIKLFFANINGVWVDKHGIKTYVYFTPEFQLIFSDLKNSWSENYRLSEPFAGKSAQNLQEFKDLQAFNGAKISHSDMSLLWLGIDGLNNLKQHLSILISQYPQDQNVYQHMYIAYIYNLMQMKGFFNNWPQLVVVDKFELYKDELVYHIAGAPINTQPYLKAALDIANQFYQEQYKNKKFKSENEKPLPLPIKYSFYSSIKMESIENSDTFTLNIDGESGFNYVRDLTQEEKTKFKELAIRLMPRHVALGKISQDGVRGDGVHSLVNNQVFTSEQQAQSKNNTQHTTNTNQSSSYVEELMEKDNENKEKSHTMNLLSTF